MQYYYPTNHAVYKGYKNKQIKWICQVRFPSSTFYGLWKMKKKPNKIWIFLLNQHKNNNIFKEWKIAQVVRNTDVFSSRFISNFCFLFIWSERTNKRIKEQHKIKLRTTLFVAVKVVSINKLLAWLNMLKMLNSQKSCSSSRRRRRKTKTFTT